MARQFTRHQDGLDSIIYADYINELQEALEEDDVRIDALAEREHTHPIGQVEGLDLRLVAIEDLVEGKSDNGHKHSASDISSGVIGTSFLPVGEEEGTIAAGNHNHDSVYPKFDALIPLNAHTANTSNPHGVTKAQVGLGNVDNTSDVAKPISTAVQTALNGKAASSHNHSADNINSGTLNVARIPNLAASKINSGTFADARIPNLAASKVTSGIFADARIPSLNASKITAGTFSTARIPSLNASKITAGTFNIARIPTGTSSSTVALGNHSHTVSTVFTPNRKVTTSTVPRSHPGTEWWAYASLPVGSLLTILGGGFSSGGVTWYQYFSSARGVVWINVADVGSL